MRRSKATRSGPFVSPVASAIPGPLRHLYRTDICSRIRSSRHQNDGSSGKSGINAEAGELTADFDGREVVYDFGELDELVLAYATTVHKAQGSEYPAVVIPLTTQHYPMLQRNLLYTAVTRGRRLVVLVAQPKAVAIAVKGHIERRRWSKLREWLAPPLAA